MAELIISENEIIIGSIDEIMDYLTRKQNNIMNCHSYTIDKNTNIKETINTILKHFKLDNEETNRRIEVLNEGSNEKIACKLIENLIDCIRFPE